MKHQIKNELYRYVSTIDGLTPTITLMRINEPSSMDYIKSFFGLFKPWPEITETEVQFSLYDNYWIEVGPGLIVIDSLSDLLFQFYNAEKNHLTTYYGRV